MAFILFQTLPATMPRNYKKKGTIQTDREGLEKAFNYRVRTGCSIRAACTMFEVRPTTLQVRKTCVA